MKRKEIIKFTKTAEKLVSKKVKELNQMGSSYPITFTFTTRTMTMAMELGEKAKLSVMKFIAGIITQQQLYGVIGYKNIYNITPNDIYISAIHQINAELKKVEDKFKTFYNEQFNLIEDFITNETPYNNKSVVDFIKERYSSGKDPILNKLIESNTFQFNRMHDADGNQLEINKAKILRNLKMDYIRYEMFGVDARFSAKQLRNIVFVFDSLYPDYSTRLENMPIIQYASDIPNDGKLHPCNPNDPDFKAVVRCKEDFKQSRMEMVAKLNAKFGIPAKNAVQHVLGQETSIKEPNTDEGKDSVVSNNRSVSRFEELCTIEFVEYIYDKIKVFLETRNMDNSVTFTFNKTEDLKKIKALIDTLGKSN